LARAAFQCASAYRAEGRLEDAVVLLRKCLEFKASHLEGRVELGTALSELGRDGEAEVVYSEGIDRAVVAGEAAALRFNRANCRIRRGELVSAREDLQTCLELLPQWAEPKVQLTSVLVEQGEFRQAKRLLEELRAAQADPALIAKIEDRLKR
jgi:Flp pilus assembly protein TadD